MPTINEASENKKNLTNVGLGSDITWDEATMTWNEAERPWNALGKPITKTAENEKNLTNKSENA